MVTVQSPPIGTLGVQVLVSEKSPGFAPEITKLEICKDAEADEALLIVTVCDEF